MVIKLKTRKRSKLLDLNLDKIWLLNLDSREDRLQHCIEQFESIGLHGVYRESAINGKELENIPKELRRFSPGMVGCWLSHKRILKEALEKGYERILVLEDDLQFAPGFNEYMDLAFDHLPDDWQFLYLGYTQFEGFDQFIHQANDYWIIPGRHWGTQGYMVNGRDTIQTLLQGLKRMTEQIDGQLQRIIPQLSIKQYAIYPCMIGQHDLGTDIQIKVEQKIF